MLNEDGFGCLATTLIVFLVGIKVESESLKQVGVKLRFDDDNRTVITRPKFDRRQRNGTPSLKRLPPGRVPHLT